MQEKGSDVKYIVWDGAFFVAHEPQNVVSMKCFWATLQQRCDTYCNSHIMLNIYKKNVNFRSNETKCGGVENE